MRAAAAFEAHRRLVFSIAYRMLGNAADADDIVQETFMRFQAADPTGVQSERGYLAAIATRLCIDKLRAGHSRHEREAQTVLPEPVPSALVVEPDDPVAFAESLSFAFLAVLERLSPAERAVFLLRDVFDFEYGEVATALNRSEPSCRQLLRRARKRIAQGRPRFRARPEQVSALAIRFAKACREGDVDGLLAMLAPDASLRTDGGTARAAYGRARAFTKPLTGAKAVARVLVSVQAQAPTADASIEDINGLPAIVARHGGRAVGVVCFEVEGGRIKTIYIVNDPEKLSRLHMH